MLQMVYLLYTYYISRKAFFSKYLVQHMSFLHKLKYRADNTNSYIKVFFHS